MWPFAEINRPQTVAVDSVSINLTLAVTGQEVIIQKTPMRRCNPLCSARYAQSGWWPARVDSDMDEGSKQDVRSASRTRLVAREGTCLSHDTVTLSPSPGGHHTFSDI